MANIGNEESGLGEKERTVSVRRRSVLSTVGAVGLAAASGRVGAQDDSESESESEPTWPEPDDEYYQTLVDDLSAMDLPPAEFVHGETEAAVFAQYWKDNGDGYATIESLDVSEDDVPFSEALRFDVTEEPPNAYDVQLRTADWHSEPFRSVESGDVLLGVAYLRAPDGNGQVQYAAENTQSTQWNSVVSDAQQGTNEEWTRHYFPIEFVADANGGLDGTEFEWSTQFHFGYGTQTVDIGGIALLHFGSSASSRELPSGKVSSGSDDGNEQDTDDDAEADDDGQETESDDDEQESEGDDGQEAETDDDDEQTAANGDDGDTEQTGDGDSVVDSVPGLGVVTGLAGLGAAAGRLVSKASDGDEGDGNEGV